MKASLLLTVLSIFSYGRAAPVRPADDLTKQYRERRKHKVDPERAGNLRKKAPDGSNAAASRLSVGDMEARANDMKLKLQSDERGDIKLKDKEKDRYQKFIDRFEELSKAKDKNGFTFSLGSNLDNNDPEGQVNMEKLEWYKQNRHKEEFKETRGLVMGKTKEEREEVAQHLRMELEDHESGVNVMDEKLYEFKKHALARYDKVNHPELVASTKTLGPEVAVSEGKTVEAVDPATFEAPPRNTAALKDEGGVIVHSEQVKRRDKNEAPAAVEEKENYRKKEAGKKVSKTLHDDGEE